MEWDNEEKMISLYTNLVCNEVFSRNVQIWSFIIPTCFNIGGGTPQILTSMLLEAGKELLLFIMRACQLTS